MKPPASDCQVSASRSRPLMQAELGMRVELGGALVGGGAGSPRCAVGTASLSLGRATGSVEVVDVADDCGEVAVADAHLAATGVGTKPALPGARLRPLLRRSRPR